MLTVRYFLSLVILVLAPYFLLPRFYPMRFRSPKGTVYRYLTDIVEKKIEFEPPELLITGDSTALLDFDIRALPNSQTFATLAGSPVEHYYFLKEYFEKYPAPRCLIYSFTYRNRGYEDGGFWGQSVGNGLYGFERANEIYQAGRGVAFPSSRYSYLDYFFRLFLNRSFPAVFYPAGLRSGFSVAAVNRKQMLYDTLVKNKGSLVTISGAKSNLLKALFPNFGITTAKEFEQAFTPSKLFDLYLDKIIVLAKANNTKFIYVYPPVFNRILDDESLQYLQALKTHMTEVVSRDENAQFFFDSNSRLLKKFYLDLTHLNTAGARIYTRRFFRRVECP